MTSTNCFLKKEPSDIAPPRGGLARGEYDLAARAAMAGRGTWFASRVPRPSPHVARYGLITGFDTSRFCEPITGFLTMSVSSFTPIVGVRIVSFAVPTLGRWSVSFF